MPRSSSSSASLRRRGPGSTPLDEERLVERVLAGSDAASRQVLAHVGPAVLRTIRGALGPGDADVDDLVQDTFVAFLKALPAYRGEAGLRTFATRIAAKLAVSTLRRRYRRGEGLIDELGGVMGPVDLDRAVVSEQRTAMVRAAMARLPRSQAETLLLRWMLGCSLREVAEITGAPVNTVRSRLRLGRNALMTAVREDPRWRELEEEAAT